MAVQPLRRLIARAAGGGPYVATLAGALSVTAEMAQDFVLDADGSNRNVTMFAPTQDHAGACWQFQNAGASGNLVLKDADANTIATLLPAQGCQLIWCGTDGWQVLASTGAGNGGTDFGAPGLQSDVIAESTSAAGVTVDGVLIKDGGAKIADSSVLSFGNDADVLMTHDGSASVRVTNAAAGTMGMDDDVLNVCDPADPTKRVRLDAGSVTAGQTRVISAPDQDVTVGQWSLMASGTISNAALKTMNATPVEMLAAPAAGYYYRVHWVHWFLDYGTVAFDAAASGDTLVAKYTDASGAAVVDAVAGDTIGAATADYHVIVDAVDEVIPVAAAAIVAHITTGEWYAAAGDSVLKYVVHYQLCALPT